MCTVPSKKWYAFKSEVRTYILDTLLSGQPVCVSDIGGLNGSSFYSSEKSLDGLNKEEFIEQLKIVSHKAPCGEVYKSVNVCFCSHPTFLDKDNQLDTDFSKFKLFRAPYTVQGFIKNLEKYPSMLGSCILVKGENSEN